MILGLLSAAGFIIAGVVIIVASRPADFRISRSKTIPAPASVLFEQVDNLQLWGGWSPWDRLDPETKKTFSGPQSGVGAVCAWEGTKAGSGQMTTIESRTNQLVRFDLKFFKPFKADNIAEFTFVPKGDQTVVTWTMTGKNNFMAKAFGLVINCDKFIGKQFEDGLANLQTVTDNLTIKR